MQRDILTWFSISLICFFSLINCFEVLKNEEPTINRVIRQSAFNFPGSNNFRPPSPFTNVRNPGNNNCNPIMKCASSANLFSCNQTDGTPGASCNKMAPLQPAIRVHPEPSPRISLRTLTSNNIRTGASSGTQSLRTMKQREQELIGSHRFLKKNTPERSHGKQFKLPPRSRAENDVALEVAFASQAIQKQLGLSPREAMLGLPGITLRGTEFERGCPVNPTCDRTAKYRTTSGECNNLREPLNGKAHTPVRRVLPPTYDDGIFTPRSRATDGNLLPNPRFVSNTVLLDVDKPDLDFTLSVMQYSQFVDHDFALSPFLEFKNGEGIECCPDRRIPNEQVFILCDPIPLNFGDRFFSPRNQTCMNFIRSMLSLNPKCTFGPAEQTEVLTHYLDGSQIYGSEEEETEVLREHIGGRLEVSRNNLLPFDPEGGECLAPLRGAKCFVAGESRVQEQVALTAIHTIWHRNHNRIVSKLASLRSNRQWTDEQLFQEGRRINVAQYQHIVYEEWLPIILGKSIVQQLGIAGQDSGFSFNYDDTINPNTGNEFASAAFRFGHSLVVGVYHLITDSGRTSTIRLRDHFNTAHFLQQNDGAIDMFIRAFINQPIQTFDPFVTSDLSNHLFQTPQFDFGMDLMTLNINRGRDHGIATYNDIREVCGLQKARNFRDLSDQISSDSISRLERVYRRVDDIDFFVGGILERPVGDGIIGWTFTCIIGDQFARSRNADRFFYDLGGQAGSFTEAQLQEIRKASWARILCDNAENVPAIQPLAFKRANNGINARTLCGGNVIPVVNLDFWDGERPGRT